MRSCVSDAVAVPVVDRQEIAPSTLVWAAMAERTPDMSVAFALAHPAKDGHDEVVGFVGSGPRAPPTSGA